MKSLLRLTILLLLSGCNTVKDPLSFNSIDYSSYWGFYNSIKILNTGKTFIYYKDFMENTYYYSLDLDKNQLDSLSIMVRTSYSIKLDSTYILERDSGRDFSLIINSDKGRLSTTYSGPYTGVEGLDKLYSFIDNLIGVSEKLRKSVDSDFDFESKTKLRMILPTPPMRE
jgi:hypothetical protein